MTRSRLAVAALVSTVALTGCGIGFNAGTQTQGPSRHMGTTVDSASLKARSANLVIDAKDPVRALFVGTLINPTADDNILIGVGADTAVVAEATVDGPTDLPAGVPVQFGFNGGRNVLLTSSADGFTPGTYVTVEFKLATGDPLKVALLVKTNTGDYADVVLPTPEPVAPPAPVVTAEPTPLPSAS